MPHNESVLIVERIVVLLVNNKIIIIGLADLSKNHVWLIQVWKFVNST